MAPLSEATGDAASGTFVVTLDVVVSSSAQPDQETGERGPAGGCRGR